MLPPQEVHEPRSDLFPKPRILIIEDNRDTGELLQQTLEDEGYEIFQAFDGGEGLKKAGSLNPDLILLDIMMPSMDGIEVCRQLRTQSPKRSIPILILTAKDALSEKLRAFKAGGDDYITKPFIISELLARIQAHLRVQTLKKDLELSEERYGRLLENSPDGILLLSPGLQLLYHNSKFTEILQGKSPEPLTGRILANLFPVSDLFREIDEVIGEAARQQQTVIRQVQLSASNHRTVYLEILGMPIRVSGAQVGMFQVIARDITQRRRMEEALIQAEKINSLGILTAGIAHEVNNPLTGISNAVQLLKTGKLAPERQSELCDLILNHIDRIVKIIKDLRIFSRPHENIPEVFSLQEAIQETLDLTKYQAHHKIEMIFESSPEPLTIFGDKNQFQQVMINLLVNAIQAIPDKGSIHISLRREGDEAHISLEDTGCGIPSDQLSQIFDPFFTTKRDWKGTGLGLAVSYRIIQLFKGTLAVQSTLSKGSRFDIALPLYPRQPRKKGLSSR